MRTHTSHILAFTLIALFFLPFIALGQTPSADFQPLAPLPNVGGLEGDGTGLSQYLNTIFFLTIGVASVLAVIMIIVNGVKYMSTEAVSGKGDARERIWGVVQGLLLIAVAYVILNTINPALLDADLEGIGNAGRVENPAVIQARTLEQQRADAEAAIVAGNEEAQALQESFEDIDRDAASDAQIEEAIENFTKAPIIRMRTNVFGTILTKENLAYSSIKGRQFKETEILLKEIREEAHWKIEAIDDFVRHESDEVKAFAEIEKDKIYDEAARIVGGVRAKLEEELAAVKAEEERAATDLF